MRQIAINRQTDASFNVRFDGCTTEDFGPLGSCGAQHRRTVESESGAPDVFTVRFDGCTIEEVVDVFKPLVECGTVDRDMFIRGVQLELGDSIHAKSPLQELYDKARYQSGQITLEENIAEVEAERKQ